MGDYRDMGYNLGRGHEFKNDYHDTPKTDSDWESFKRGVEDGERHRRISDDLDREAR